MYYHAEIGRSISNRVDVSRRLPQNFGNAALRPLQFGVPLPKGITMANLVALGGMSRGFQKFGERCAPLLRIWGVSDRWKHAPPHRCYHRKFGRSEWVGVPKNVGRWAQLPYNGGVLTPLKTRSSPHMWGVFLWGSTPPAANLVALAQTVCASVGSQKRKDAGSAP